jgi:hypothetical protein
VLEEGTIGAVPRLASSATPIRPPRASAHPGARHGRIRFRADLGVGRHLQEKNYWQWYHCAPRAPLVRADGVVLTDWNGVVVAHGPRGERLWERDLTVEPEKAWHEYWGGLLLVDDADRVWVETTRGLLRLLPDGSEEMVTPNLKAGGFTPGVGTPVPDGFVRSYGTDEGWYTGHWPCGEGEVERLDDAGRTVRTHAVPLCPAGVRLRNDGHVLAFFTDAVAGERDLALELDERGELVATHETRAKEDELQAWKRSLLGPPDDYDVDVAWGRAIRLRHRQHGVVLEGVAADAPAIDVGSRAYTTRLAGEVLSLVALDDGKSSLEVPLIERAEPSIFHFAHGGRPASTWHDTGWFEAPTVIGAGGSTLVVTNLADGRCELICVE